MKKIIYIVLLAYSGLILAQNKTLVTIHGEKITYDLQMTKAERDAIVAPTVGMTIFNTTTQCHEFYDGTGWYNYCWRGKRKPFEYGTIQGIAGKIWMDRNLGADREAQSSNDYEAYGSLYQWGRSGLDNHQYITWTGPMTGSPENPTTTSTKSDTPSDNKFITSSGDWRTTNNTLWDGYAAVNNPCPSGFRMPTEAEWASEFLAGGGINNAADAYTRLKLTVSGSRSYSTGALMHQGNSGYYWTSTPNGPYSKDRYFSGSGTGSVNRFRADGMSVRCIKD